MATAEDTSELQKKQLESCIFKVMHGDARTGRRVLGSSGVHPASLQTVDLMKGKFVVDPARDTIAQRPGLSQRAARCKPAIVQKKIVSAVIAKTADCKASGTSSWRNSRLKNIASSDSGLAALTSWAQAWVSGTVPEIMAAPWRAVLGVPLRKGDGGEDVRPIMIGEALLSLPGACLQEALQGKVARLLSDTQLGIGIKAGPESFLCIGKALARLCPNDAFCAFDMHNAFGEVSRAEILEEVIHDFPEIAPYLINLWGAEGTPVHIASGATSWASFEMRDGLYQGHTLSSLLFCLGLRRALRRFLREYSGSPCSAGGTPVHLEYMDDMLFKFDPSLACTWLPLLTDALFTVNLRLNITKTKVWVPSSADGVLHPALQQAGLHQVFDGLEVMGGALDGQFAASIGHPAVPAASLKRTEQAEKLAQTMQLMLRTPLAQPAHRAAWTLLDKVLNKALDYDARILHPESFSTIAERLDRAVLQTSCKVVRVDGFTEVQEQCLRLPARLGGCDLVSAGTKRLFMHLAGASQYMPSAAQ